MVSFLGLISFLQKPTLLRYISGHLLYFSSYYRMTVSCFAHRMVEVLTCINIISCVFCKVCFIKTDTLYIGGTYIKCVYFYKTDFMSISLMKDKASKQDFLHGFCKIVCLSKI